ncbi:unnamed protein product [Pedinophyceae sp. YPF-701]|nr:unnamed protein product [Pedinophyceae sp. YPF-701]
MSQVPRRDLWIDGRWQRPAAGGRIDVVSPATEEVIGSIPAGTAEDVDRAVAAARSAFRAGPWGSTTGRQRASVLRSIAAEILRRKDQLAVWETADCGKPLDESKWDIDDASACFEYYADLAERLDGEQYKPVALPMKDFSCHLRKEPVGVVGLITPWNYPLLMAVWGVAAALAAGCTVVLKPSELASVTCLELGELCCAAGLPAGALNVVSGDGPAAGAPLAAHRHVAKVSFTGSVASGGAVARAAAANAAGGPRPATMELGGKSALIVFDDADVDNAVEWCMFGCFWTNGQICSATSRLLVHESIADRFYRRLKARAESIQAGDPMAEGCRLGPVVSRRQYEKVMGMIAAGRRAGAQVLTGGGRPPRVGPRGFFVAPTVLTGVRSDNVVWREEIFGPVLAAATFRTEDEAVAMANDSELGLAGAVISQDLARCQRVARRLEAGIVWVNCSQPCFAQAPWGGMKNSGYGRHLGEAGMENYLQLKQITEYLVPEEVWDWYPQNNVSAGPVSKM